jgi:hypothetical protein
VIAGYSKARSQGRAFFAPWPWGIAAQRRRRYARCKRLTPLLSSNVRGMQKIPAFVGQRQNDSAYYKFGSPRYTFSVLSTLHRE